MNFLLLLVMFNGNVVTTYHSNSIKCESALFESTDLGKMKQIKVAQCINLKRELK